MSQSTRRPLIVLTGLLIFAFLLSACASGNQTGTPGAVETMVPGEVTEPVEMTEPVEGTEVVETTEPAMTESPTTEATEGGEATQEGTASVPVTGVDDVSPVGEPVALGLELFAEGFVHPLVMLPAPGDDSGRLFVADQTGVIYIVSADGQVSETPFLDLRDRMVEIRPQYDERGLLGLAFHPDYAENGRFFVYYSAPLAEGAPAEWNHTSHISEFTVSADNPDAADAESERILLTVDQPQGNHDGGQITFGPDGYLYIPLGDGGAADDNDVGHVDDWYEVNAGGNGQDLEQNLLGSILRIDVDSGDPYGIPGDNPREDEQWAWGFRNPYRISFDMEGDGRLYVGDAGQNLFEEVSVVGPEGGNFGWNVKEGTHCFSTDNPDQPLDECPGETPEGEPLIDPVIEFLNTATYQEGLGNTVIGGNVYHGSAIPELDGMYVFGVWSTTFEDPDGAVYVSEPQDGEGLWEIRPVQANVTGSGERLGEFLLSFGVDADNELYLLTTEETGPQGETGKIYKLVAAE